MNVSLLLRLTSEVFVALGGNLIEEGKGRSVVVWPVVVCNSVTKVPFCVVGGSFGCVDNVVLVAMFFVQELSHLHVQIKAN